MAAREDERAPTIVLASEDQPSQAPLRAMLEGAGCRVVTVADGAGALAALAVERPDLIVVDLFLPDLEAPTFLRSVRKRRYSGPVVALMPSEDVFDIVRREHRDVYCVNKHASPGEIKDAVLGALGGGRRGGG